MRSWSSIIHYTCGARVATSSRRHFDLMNGEMRFLNFTWLWAAFGRKLEQNVEADIKFHLVEHRFSNGNLR